MVSLFKSARTDVNYRSHTEIDVISRDKKGKKNKNRSCVTFNSGIV